MELKEHNKKAYDNLINTYKAGQKRVCIVHPTGTGKTYIAMQYILDHSNEKIILVSPTIAILNYYKQRLEENEIDYSNVEFITYSKLMQMNENEQKNLKADNIILDEFHHCGAKEWGKGVKSLIDVSNSKVLGLSATPIRYLDKLRNMAEEVFVGNIASEISLPEAILDGLLESPIYHQGLYSPIEENFELRAKIEKLSPSEAKAVLRKELEKVRHVTEKMEKTNDILKAGIPKEKKKGRYIVFCRNIEDMHKAMKNASKWFKGINEVEIYSMATKNMQGRTVLRKHNKQEMELFETSKSPKAKLMFAVDMLNEGVHISGIDGIIMLRPTKSPILYRQQIGRVLSIGGTKTPLVFDFADNIHCTDYVFNLYQEMQDTIEKRKKQGKNTSKEEKRLKDFKINDHIKEIRELLLELDDKTYQKIWEEQYEKLVEYINSTEEAREYLRKTGQIRQKEVLEDGTKIGTWVNSQRQKLLKKYAGKTIEEIEQDESIRREEKDKVVKLLKLGIVPPKPEQDWEEQYEKLVEYINSTEEVREYLRKTGKIRRREVLEDGTKIGTWVDRQRQRLLKKYAGKTIEEIEQDESIQKEEKYKVVKLLKLGIVPPKPVQDWEEQYEKLVEYINSTEEVREYLRNNGSIKSKTVLENGTNIGTWVDSQRQKLLKKYAGKTIEEIEQDESIPKEEKYKVIKLLKLGIVPPKPEQDWEEQYEKLVEYINSTEEVREYLRKTGSIKSRIVLEDGNPIGIWVNNQKQKLLKKYAGKTIEEVEQDESIPKEEKDRVIKLLRLGIIPLNSKKEKLQDMIEKSSKLDKSIKDAKALEIKYEAELSKKDRRNMQYE